MDAMVDYLAQDRRHALAGGESLPARANGSVVFADISGWTALTAHLNRKLGARRGIERLTEQLNAVYDLLVGEVDRYGGSVVHFAGDGITCWFAADRGERAIACALAMQATLKARRETPGLGDTSVGLALRAAITSGEAWRFVVGDPAIQRLDLLTGPLLNRLARIEALAERHEVVADSATLAACGVAAESWRVEPGDPAQAARVGVLGLSSGTGADLPPPAAPASAPAALPSEQLRPWLIPAVFSHLSSGAGEFLTELRPAAILFARFGGLDYEADPEAGQRLDQFVRRAQAIVERYDGTLFNLNTDAAGNVLSAAFGVPKAHQNDAMRAAAVACELRQAAADSAGISGVQTGICQGVVWAGAYGGATRRTYGVLGDEVNMAARLMGQAAPGQILASAAVQAATGAAYRWHPLPPRLIKGKEQPVELFSLDAPRDQANFDLHEPSYVLPMVGRAAELALVGQTLDLAARGRGQIIGITAEAGMGKSRLLAEAIQLAEQQGWRVYGGPCQSYGTGTPYLVWQPILRAFFGLAPDLPPDEQERLLAAALERIDPALLPRLPLLGVALNLPLPENELTGGLDAATRKQSLEALIIACLRATSRRAARDQAPRLMLVLEDCHWIDPLSHDLLERVCRAISQMPVAVITIYRPFDLERLQAPRIVALPYFTEIRLQELAPAELEALVDSLLAQRGRSLPALLVAQLIARSQGIPFYLEELINYIEDQSTALATIELPASLHSLILSRVDLLSDHQKVTIKVASIIGRLFRAGWLWGYYPALGSPDSVLADLTTLSRLDITPLELPEPELTYLFKHAITHEVVYESLPYARRAELHEQFAAFLEAGPQPEQQLPQLAFHYTRSGNMAKRRLYNRLAADAAQAAAAHVTALEYYNDVLPWLDDPEEQAEIRFQMGGVTEMMGRWAEAAGHFDAVLALAESGALAAGWRARSLHARGKVLSKQGEFAQALEFLSAAEAAASGDADRSLRANILNDIGTVKWRQGAFDEGLACLELALGFAQAADDRRTLAHIYNTLGNLTYSQGNLPAARAYQERSFQLRQELGNRRGMTSSLTNLGMAEINVGNYAAARPLFEQSLEIANEIGDVLGTMIGALNIATLDYKLGDLDQARRGYRESMSQARDLGDRLALVYGLLGVAAVAAARNQAGDAADAVRWLAASQAGLVALGAVLEPYEQIIHDETLALLQSRLEPADFAALWSDGLALPLADAVAAALGE